MFKVTALLFVIFSGIITGVALGITIHAGYDHSFIANEDKYTPLGLTVTNNAESIRITGKTLYGYYDNVLSIKNVGMGEIGQFNYLNFKFIEPIIFTENSRNTRLITNLTVHPNHINRTSFISYFSAIPDIEYRSEGFGIDNAVVFNDNYINQPISISRVGEFYGNPNWDIPFNEMIWYSWLGAGFDCGFIDIEINSITLIAILIPEVMPNIFALGLIAFLIVQRRKRKA